MGLGSALSVKIIIGNIFHTVNKIFPVLYAYQRKDNRKEENKMMTPEMARALAKEGENTPPEKHRLDFWYPRIMAVALSLNLLLQILILVLHWYRL